MTETTSGHRPTENASGVRLERVEKSLTSANLSTALAQQPVAPAASTPTTTPPAKSGK